jgi:hypothetical protein
LYEAGAVDKQMAGAKDKKILSAEQSGDFNLARTRRFLYRTRYFTDSGIIGTKDFVQRTYQRVQENFDAKREKIPKPISGLGGIYSLKRLTE